MILSLCALLLQVVIPGVAGAVFLRARSGRESIPGMLGPQAVLLGVGIWVVGSGILERTVGITPRSSWTFAAILGVVGLVVLALPSSLRELARSVREIGEQVAVIALATVSWLPIGLVVFRARGALSGSTPWYYWGLAQQIVANHHVPATSREWGQQLPFLSDYRLFSTASAELISQGRGDGSTAIHIISLMSVVLMGAGAAALVRSLGGSAIAGLVSVPLTVGTGFGLSKLVAYRPETFGLGLAMLLVACVIVFLRTGARGMLLVSAVGGAALWKTHGIAFAFAGLLCVAAVVALVPGRGEAPYRRRVLWPYLRRAIGVGLAVVVAAVACQLLLGSGSSAALGGGLADRGGLHDMTWQFTRATTGGASSMPPTNWAMFSGVVGDGYAGHVWQFWLAAGIAGLLLLVLAVRNVWPRRQAALVGVALVGFALVAAFFAYRWAGYVPRRTGVHRMLFEALLLLGPMIAWACDGLGRLRRPAVVVALVAATAIALVSGVDAMGAAHDQIPSHRDIRALRHLRLSSDDVVLANAYGEGFLPLVTGADSLLDGRAPYTFPDQLRHATRLLRHSQVFFKDPQQHLSFLRSHHVDYVILGRPGSWSLGTSKIWRRVKRGRFVHIPQLKLVRQTKNLRIYRFRSA
ncbi:MAG: hypothetical protein FWE71_09620 [Nocardioidaceae bacterium]|nr:hypothetical protein [Nocardioidaceae bacterium]MCL2612336.1 hypothetical protein [Nocardioidaceae bacterium]